MIMFPDDNALGLWRIQLRALNGQPRCSRRLQRRSDRSRQGECVRERWERVED